ncbi:MAG: XRE family transcriptional regulator [Coriobacteriales bacterium]|jgi:transcriptional regulator with XRE-family HTH domain|nr:XRE family transcriptional regulator [Coriobacteriales bacterium]
MNDTNTNETSTETANEDLTKLNMTGASATDSLTADASATVASSVGTNNELQESAGENAGTIGAKITELRTSLMLSPDDLAQRSGCDVKVINDLEKGALAPSLSPLIKITRALGVRLGTLLDDDENLGPVLTRANDYRNNNASTRLKGLETHSDAGELTFNALAEGKASRHMEPFFIELNPSDETTHELSAHEGEEWLFALEGPLEVAYGKDLYVLQPGDSIYYDSIVPHQVRSYQNQKAKFVACVYTPA